MTDPRRGGTSASNAQADDLCPGRHLAQVGMPDTPSADAAFGRAIHDALSSEGPETSQTIGKLDTQQRNIFDSCREIEKKKMIEYFGQREPENGGPGRTRVFREVRYFCQVLKAEGSDVRYEHSGQPDMVMRRVTKLLICEYKTLPGDLPDSPSNMQLRDQAVLAAKNLKAISEVGVFINQPLVTHDPVIAVYDAAALDRAEKEMFERVRRSNDPKSPRIAGEVQCKFCKAKRSCAEYTKWAGSELPEYRNTPFAIQASQWTLEQRTHVAEHLPRLRKLLKDSEDFLKDCLAKDPESVPGFWLEPGDNRETITDVQALYDRFNKKGGTLKQFMQCIAVVKGRLEGQVREVTKTKGKGLLGEMEALLDGITESKQNAPSLAKKKETP